MKSILCATILIISASASAAFGQDISGSVASLNGSGSIFFGNTALNFPLTLTVGNTAKPVIGVMLQVESGISTSVEGACGMPGTFFPCPGASTPAMYYQDVTGVVNTPSLPVFEPQTYSVPMTLKGDAFTSATLAKAYEWATPIPPADASAFSGPVNINVNVSEGVYPTDAAGSLQVFSDAFAGTANVTATLLVGPLSRPKPTLLQKTGSAAEIAVISALTRALTAECPPCGVLYGTFTAPVISGLRKIVQDPDDPNYMVLATLDIPPTIALPDIPGLTAEQIALWNDLNENLALLDPLAEALAESIDRAQGAYDAGNEFWAAAQLANFNDYYQQDLTYATAVDSDAVMLGLVSASGGPGTPEPSTWTMMLLGFAGLGYLGYRSSRKSIALAV